MWRIAILSSGLSMTLLSDVQIEHHQNLWGNGRELSSPQKKSKNVLLGKSIDALSGYPHVCLIVLFNPFSESWIHDVYVDPVVKTPNSLNLNVSWKKHVDWWLTPLSPSHIPARGCWGWWCPFSRPAAETRSWCCFLLPASNKNGEIAPSCHIPPWGGSKIPCWMVNLCYDKLWDYDELG